MNQIKCDYCGAVNNQGEYCGQCGSPLHSQIDRKPDKPQDTATSVPTHKYAADNREEIEDILQEMDNGEEPPEEEPKKPKKEQVRMTMRIEGDIYEKVWKIHTETKKSLVSIMNGLMREALR